jgi:hypothetical protein
MGYLLELYLLSPDRLGSLLIETASDARIPEHLLDGLSDLRSGSNTDAAALALAHIIRANGQQAASLEHASLSGIAFRNVVETLAPELLRRDLLEVRRDELPWFGWLEGDEVRSLRARNASSDGGDEAGWATDLMRALRLAENAGTGIVGIYT